jgi:hypothetical protein
MMRDTSPDIGPLLDGMVNRIADAVASRLAQQMPQTALTDDLVDEPTMAQRLNVSQPTLQRMRSAGEVPYAQIGRRIAYCPQQVLAALTHNKSQGSEDV